MKETFWNTYAKPYTSVEILLPYQDMLTDVVKFLKMKPGLKLLDAGCGTGNFARKILSEGIGGARVEMCDFSKDMLEVARISLAKYASTKIFLHDLNECLNYPDEAFHRVVCTNVLYTLKDPEFAISELARILRVGGRIVLVHPDRPQQKMLYHILLSHFRALVRRDHVSGIVRGVQQIPPLFRLLMQNIQIVRDAQYKRLWFASSGELRGLCEKFGITIVEERRTYAESAVLICGEKSGESVPQESVSIRLVGENTDLEAVFRLRYRVYCEYLRSLNPNEYPEGMETDSFDEHAIHFGAFEGNRIVGYVRFVKDSPRGFLLDGHVDLPDTIPRFTTLEGSRLIGHKRYGVDVPTLLLAFAHDYTKHAGYTHWLAMWNRKLMLKHVRRYDEKWQALGAPIEYHNTISVPYVLSLGENIYRNIS